MGLHDDLIAIDAASAMIGPDSGSEYWDRMRAGGITAVAITVGGGLPTFAAWYQLFCCEAERLLLVTRAEDIRLAKAEGKIGVIFHFQKAHALEDQVGFVEVFYRLGVRILQLTYNDHNLLGAGCLEEPDSGLTRFGLDVVREMNRVGMVVDVSHVGYRTSMDAVEASEDPVVASHSNAWSVCNNPRNLRDDLIRAIAQRGGVIGVTAFPSFVRWEAPTIEHLLDHIDHMSHLVGTEHLGIGLDFCKCPEDGWKTGRFGPAAYPPPPWIFPSGMAGPENLPNLTQGLQARGYADSDIRNILGGNFLRLYQQVWKTPLESRNLT